MMKRLTPLDRLKAIGLRVIRRTEEKFQCDLTLQGNKPPKRVKRKFQDDCSIKAISDINLENIA